MEKEVNKEAGAGVGSHFGCLPVWLPIVSEGRPLHREVEAMKV
jgi:hypothetical protein